MGASASLSTEVFTAAKEEYELRKNDGLSDEQLFNHMKDFIESRAHGAPAEAHAAEAHAEGHAAEEHHHEEAAPAAEHHEAAPAAEEAAPAEA